MFSNRISTLFNSVHIRRSAVPIYFRSFHTSFNGKHNLCLIKKIESNILASSKCSPLFVNSLSPPVRHYGLTDRSDSLGNVQLLRGVRSNFAGEVEMPTPFRCTIYLFNLTKVLESTSITAIFEFMSGFEQGFVVYNELLRQRNPNDLDRDWLQPTAQEDSRDIINRLPNDYWKVVEDHEFLLPYCIGYKVDRNETPSSVETAFLFPSTFGFADKELFWHLVYTRKFGEGVTDSWSIKNVAVYMVK